MTLSNTSLLGRKNYKFQNWAGIYSTTPQLHFEPETIDQVIEIVKSANEKGQKITIVGAGHTPNNICITKNWMVSLTKLNHVGMLCSNHANYADVTVEAGITSHDLNEYLTRHGYSLQNLPSINTPTMAGMISTGSHGSSAYHGLVSSQIVNITLVNGQGELVFVDSDTQPELFRAMLLSLGQVGIIVKLTIRVVPNFNLRVTQEIFQFDQIIDMWDSIWLSKEYIKIWWYPYNKKCVIWKGERTSDAVPKDGGNSGKEKQFLSNRFNRFLYQFLLWCSSQICGRLTPFVEKWVFKRQYKDVAEPNVITSLDGFTLDCLYSQFVDEWGCPLVKGPEVLRKLESIVDEGAKTNKFYVHSPVEIRCSNTTTPSDLSVNDSERDHLSKGAIYGNNLRPFLDNTNKLGQYVAVDQVTNDQLTLFINATMYRPFGFNSNTYNWFTQFEQVMIEADGEPHWAKNFIGSTELITGPSASEDIKYKDYQCRGLGKFIKERFQDNLIEFQKIKSTQDPNGIFETNQDWLLRNGIAVE